MKIEIAEPARMTQTGSSLLKLIQNNNMPILDLLVRESIQNSLDAGNEDDDYVEVDFLTGKFQSDKLNNELELITESLNRKFPLGNYEYIAVRDSKTTGLTGKLHYDEVTDNQYGNLLKLIYEISKPQETEGAGGSWGLGKTVYFRVGIGLIIYYSRIINEKGLYESRLAATLVENEMEDDSLIPRFDGKSKRGIAWWGEGIGKNKTKPITDETYINKIIKIFDIEPYRNDETGTTIIIPYIEEKKLLSNNQIEYKNGENGFIIPFWRNSIDEYLKIAIQRWYAPRLNNKNYQYGKFLKARVNDVKVTLDIMEPSFQIIQSLYNRAIMADSTEDILDSPDVKTKVEKINLRKVLKDSCVGTIAFAKVPRKILKTTFPDNKPEPYMYYNCEIKNIEKNKPVICFTRKPGMIVSYEDVGKWVDGINTTNKDEFIFGVFVLNSKNHLNVNEKNYSLEEYVRKSEMADHTSWNDFSIRSSNPRIISKIQEHVKSKITKEFFIEEEDSTTKLSSGFGKLFGDLLLPPENFGKKASFGQGNSIGTKSKFEKHKNIILSYNLSKNKYFGNEMTVQFDIKSRGKISALGIKLAIDSENGKIDSKDWELKMGMHMPFEIKESNLEIEKYDKQHINQEFYVSYDNVKDSQEIGELELIKSDRDMGIGIYFSAMGEHKFEMKMFITLHLYRKDLKPVFIIYDEEGER